MKEKASHTKIAMTIGEMGDRYRVSARTLRFYEEMGLLNPLRAGWARVYSPADEVRLQIVLRARKLGFTLREIDRLIQSHLAQMKQEPEDLGEVLDKETIEQQLAALEGQKADIEAAIVELKKKADEAP